MTPTPAILAIMRRYNLPNPHFGWHGDDPSKWGAKDEIAGLIAYGMDLEDQLDAAKARVAELEVVVSCLRAELADRDALIMIAAANPPPGWKPKR